MTHGVLFASFVCIAGYGNMAAGIIGRHIEADQLADMLADSQVLATEMWRTQFDMRVYDWQDINEAIEWNDGNLRSLETYEYASTRGEICVIRQVVSGPRGKLYRQINVWSGDCWGQWVDGAGVVELSGKASPPDMLGYGFIFNCMEGAVPSRLHTIEEKVRGGRLIRQSYDDDMLVYVFKQEGEYGDNVQHEIKARIEPEFALLEYSIALYSVDGEDRLVGRQSYVVDSWGDYGGKRLPKTAYVDMWRESTPNDPESSQVVGRVLYTRTAFSPITSDDVDHSKFDTIFKHGTKVHDERMNLSYEIGKSYLYLDGTMYETDGPIMAPPGDRLGELIGQAVPYTPTISAQSSTGNTNMTPPAAALVQEDTTPGWRKLLAVGLFAGAASIVLYIAVKMKKAKAVKS
jgi:hypothetical protein